MVHLPLVCTSNSFGNIDYGIPIVANKSTDYRTSTGTYHRAIPNLDHGFDCRVKARIKPELLYSEPTVRDITVKSLYGDDYVHKFPKKSVEMQGPPRFYTLGFVKAVQERIFKKPPPPKPLPISEMKDKYYRRYVVFERQEVFPPEPYAKCEIKGLGRDEQPAVRPEEKGYYKLLDPYVSVSRGTHVPFSKNQQDGVARKDIITFYDFANYPKVKGFGPKTPTSSEPLVARKKVPMTDRMPFKLHPTERHLRNIPKRVPHFGAKSEYNGSFVQHSFSNMYPYLYQNGVDFPESLPGSSAWQDLAPPGMYCTDYCHIGSGWPVNSVMDYGLPKKHVVHKPCYTKFCDWSQ